MVSQRVRRGLAKAKVMCNGTIMLSLCVVYEHNVCNTIKITQSVILVKQTFNAIIRKLQRFRLIATVSA